MVCADNPATYCGGLYCGWSNPVSGYDPFRLMDIPVVAYGYGWIPVQGSGLPGPSFSGSVGAGNFSAASFLNVNAYWGPTSLGYLGDAFIVLQPGSISVPATFNQTVQMFKNMGVAPSALDNRVNPFHGTDFNLRDFSPVCSAHVTLNINSGQLPGQPTTGSIHFDAFNPTFNVPLYPISGEGVQASELVLHGAFDVVPYLLHLPPAGALCQQ